MDTNSSKIDDLNYAVIKFLDALKRNDVEALYKATTLTWQSNNNPLETIWLFVKPITDWEIRHVDHITPVLADVLVTISFGEMKKSIVCRCVKEVEPYKTGTATKGKWGVNPISATKNMY